MQISVKLCLFAAVSWVWCIKLLFTSRMCFTEMHFTWNIHVWGKMTGTLSGSYVMLISGCFCVHDFHHQWPTWQAVNNDLQWWAMITPSCFLTSVKEIYFYISNPASNGFFPKQTETTLPAADRSWYQSCSFKDKTCNKTSEADHKKWKTAR